MCGKFEIGCSIKEGFQSIVSGQFDSLATKIGELASAGLQAVATFWMKIDSPTLDPDALIVAASLSRRSNAARVPPEYNVSGARGE